ncbi:MAG TPA: ABC transporter permease [Edaphobacter sp.]|nr:ABC transporter permease [Edaphobacter sp.]
MSLPGEFKRRIQMLFHRNQFYRDLDEEMRLHLELRRQQQIDRGLNESAAARSAHLKFGNTTRIKEKSIMTWGSEGLESFFGDIAYGIRALLRSPALTIVALLSLALGIGANTAIFSLLDAVMLRSLPVKDPQQLVLLGEGRMRGIGNDVAFTQLFSNPFFRQFRQRNAVFSDVAGIFSLTNDVHGFVEGSNESQRINVQLVTGNYFPLLGVHAHIGRTLMDADDNSEGDHPVAVISYAWWKRALAQDPNVLGKKIKIGPVVYTIVGVAPPEFFGTVVGEAPQVWIPLAMVNVVPPNYGGYKDNFGKSLNLIGRLNPGVSIEQATANVNLLFQQITRSFPDAKLTQLNLKKLDKAHVTLTPMSTGLSSIRSQFSQPLKILMAVTGLVLLIACANIANLLLARATTRARELAIRQALGAGRTRIIRQLLTESLLLAIAGGAFGIALASVSSRVLLRMASDGPETIPLDLSINSHLLLFNLAVTIATALIFGTVPALRATRLQLTDSLKTSRNSNNSSSKNRLAQALIVSQVSLSLVLMIGAGLFLRSLVNLSNADTGFNKQDVLRLRIDSSAIAGEANQNALFHQIEDRVRALPNVRAASFCTFSFGSDGSWNSSILTDGIGLEQNINASHDNIGNGYFATMGIPLIAGRSFSSSDTSTSPRVAILSQRMAKILFPVGNPIGRRYYIGDKEPQSGVEVIGIVKDVKTSDVTEDPRVIDYLPYTQYPWGFGNFQVRYTRDFATMATAVQQTIHSIDRSLPISDVTTLDEQVARSYINQRLVAQLSTFFGLLAVFLSAIGIYGLMSYVVSRRTNEIGIRMALGAPRSNVSWLVMREILLLVAIGIAIGIPAALAGDRLVANMLFGVKSTDPAALLTAMALLLTVAVSAGYFPARRAARVDPMEALRYE